MELGILVIKCATATQYPYVINTYNEKRTFTQYSGLLQAMLQLFSRSTNDNRI